jgi:holo-[acyl-carrier protein] synthase
MMLGIGYDLIEVSRVAGRLAEDGAAFRESLFTPAEIAYCDAKHFPAQHYAARFAAKEAAFKALAVAPDAGVAWREVEVVLEAGVPGLSLTGRTRELADRLGVRRAFVSLTHIRELAAASVVLED